MRRLGAWAPGVRISEELIETLATALAEGAIGAAAPGYLRSEYAEELAHRPDLAIDEAWLRREVGRAITPQEHRVISLAIRRYAERVARA